jgi:ABC-type Fe3+-hydroxamate transport system substrate-binding protein
MPEGAAPIVVVDALGCEVRLSSPARRIVSLVPSETLSVAAIADVERLAGRTEFCVEPAGEIERVPTVGGTKSIDVAAIIALAPDLVLANKEENTPSAVLALRAAGLPVHVSFPCTVDASNAYLRALARLCGVDADASAPIVAAERAVSAAVRTPRPSRRVFVPIWRDPWMTFDARTFASDLLALAGADNLFADRARRYPLAADVAEAAPVDPGDRDTRYPRVSLEEVAARAPDLILLPDEPYAFGEADAVALRARFPGARVLLAPGADLFWYGTHVAAGLERLASLLAGEPG